MRWGGAIACGLCFAVLMTGALDWQVAQIREASPWPYLEKAQQLHTQNDLAGAQRMLAEASLRAPFLAEPHLHSGLIYYDGKKWDKALEAYQRALRLGATGGDVRGKILWCLIHLKRADEAAEFGRAAVIEGHDSPRFMRYVADAFRYADRQAESLPYLEAALQGFPNDLLLMDRIAQVLEQLGETEKAAAMRKRIAEGEDF